MRRIAVVESFKEAEDLASELMGSGHYVGVSYFRAEDGLYEVWVEDKEEE